MRKILIIKFSAIGDVVESLPVAAALKELYKDGCEITWITKKCHMCLLENNEFIDKIICFEDIKSTYFRLLKEIFRNVNLVGLTDLRQMAIVISRSTVVVSGDSGPMHMAYSLGRFVIALMWPTDPVQFGPYGNKNKIIRVNHECRGCQLTVCPFGRDCLFDINPCDVIKELQIILESGGIRV